ncbi:MAG: conserved phage C-terminal domain-containing protein [Gammaproteobacteria bacterium]
MREYAKVPAQFWINEQGRKIRKLGTEAQLISLYLFTNSHATMIGVYYLPITLIAHETCLSQDEANKGLADLCNIGFCSYDEITEYVWVHEMASEQIGLHLKPNDNRVKSVNEIVSSLPPLPFLNEFYSKYSQAYFLELKAEANSTFEAPSKPLLSQEQEQEQKQDLLISTEINEKSISFKKQAIEVLEFLNEKTGRRYRPVEANLKLIIARLKSGASVMDCRQVIAKKTREWKKDEKMSDYLRPATLFNAIKFEQYVGELVMPKEESMHANVK